jgi:hypothetical protein
MDQAELINAYNAANGGAFNLEMMKVSPRPSYPRP